ncbi:hypothetical protein Goari_000553 [Gossypium aridum]|uniref:Aminotransferase class I/classII domain-containing protein n=1 Tax=Gossypium aridum TaxID=34290 RepID=A0A7J8YHV5_GOSAI|nr:hypothetical protein [Gossypium aridum]
MVLMFLFHHSQIVESITGFLNISTDPATFIQVKLNVSLLEDISDDLDFCMKLAKEESVIIVPAGMAFGMKNWLRITFACEISALEDGLRRIKAFHQRHVRKQSGLYVIRSLDPDTKMLPSLLE